MNRPIAIIPARGGSKRIPGKNIRSFCGAPILSYSIKAALESNLFDTVMVSTDDPKIAETSQGYGASVPFMRSKKTSDDLSTTEDVLLEVLNEYKKMGREFDTVCCIYPTAPFVTAKKLRDAYDMLLKEECDSVFPVVPFSFPPQRGLCLKDGFLDPVNPDDYMKRSQDLETVYHDTGQFYFFRTESFLRTGSTVNGAKPIVTDEMEVQDIDTLTDWTLAELKYRMMTK